LEPAGIKVTQSLNVVVTTTRVEMIVAPIMNVVRRGVVIGFVTNLGRGSGKFLVGRNLSRSSGLLVTTSGIVGTP
jgi:hypothetical protein